MLKKGNRDSSERIVSKLLEAEVVNSKGYSTVASAKNIDVADQTFYCWWKEYGGLRTERAKRLITLEKENARR